MNRGLPWPVVIALALGTWAVVLVPVFARHYFRQRRNQVPASAGHPLTAAPVPAYLPEGRVPYGDGPLMIAPTEKEPM